MSDDLAILFEGGTPILGELTDSDLLGVSRLIVGRDSGRLIDNEWRSDETDGRYQAVIRWDGSTYEAWSAMLQDNVDELSPTVVTKDPTTVIRVLAYALSTRWRARRKLPPVMLPAGTGHLQPGFAIDSLHPTAITWSIDSKDFSATLGNINLMIALSYIADCSRSELVDSLQSVSGYPLFLSWR